MAGVYPGAIRTWTRKTDQVTTVDAADVNDLQDEMGAVQRTLGVNPLTYASTGEPTVTYNSVATRLGYHEATLGKLQNSLDTLAFAASNGWSTPVLRVSQGGVVPGQLSLANPTNFSPVAWKTPPTQDVGDMWTPGTTLICALGGWHILELSFSALVDVPNLTSAQAALNGSGIVPVPVAYQHVVLNLKINGALVKSHPSVVPLLAFYPSQHLLNFTWSGALHQGDAITAETGQYNGQVTGTATFAATYQRALPGVV